MKLLVLSQLIAILCLLASVSALDDSSRAGAAATGGPEGVSAISHLVSKPRRQDALFSEAVQLLDSLKTSPSCNRIAANKLVASCQDLAGKEDNNSDAHETLDRIRSVYAARLAICELDGAGASVPSPCLPVTASPSATKPRFGFATRYKASDNGTDVVPYELLEQCLRALESRPQWWTSYSNSRQNAMIICQASRMEVEQEEVLNLHRSILKSSIKLDRGLQTALCNAETEAAQHQAFVQAVQVLQEGVVRDIENTQSLFQRTFEKILHEVEAGINTILAAVNASSRQAQAETAVLERDIRNASSQVISLQDALQTAHRDAITRDLQTIRVHEAHKDIYMRLASDLHLSLESLVETDITRLSERVIKFDAMLEWLTSRLVLILEQENNMSERLQFMEGALQTSQAKANELQQAQRLQAQALAAQAQAQQILQSSVQISQAWLDKVTSSAANLHSVIDEAATRYQQTPGLRFASTSMWTMCLPFLLAIGSQNPKFAVSILFLIFGHLVATWFLQSF